MIQRRDLPDLKELLLRISGLKYGDMHDGEKECMHVSAYRHVNVGCLISRGLKVEYPDVLNSFFCLLFCEA